MINQETRQIIDEMRLQATIRNALIALTMVHNALPPEINTL